MSDWDDRHPPEPRDPSEGVRIIGPEEAAEGRRRDPRARFRSGPRAAEDPREMQPPVVPLEPRGPGGRERQPGREAPRRAPESDLSHWGDTAFGAAPDEEELNMDRRDPYEGDEAAAWGSFAGQEPRWRDDVPEREPRRAPAPEPRHDPLRDPRQDLHEEPGRAPRGGYPEPPPGRSVFDDEPRVATESYEDAYRDQSYDDRGQDFTDRSQNYAAAPEYPDRRQEYVDHSYDDRGNPPPPPRQGPQDTRFDQNYDDNYSDDVYQETPQVYVEPPEPPRQAPRGRGRGRPDGPPKEPGSESDMRIRIAVGIGMAAAALVLFKLGPAPAMALAVAVLGMASFEYFTATQRAGFDPLMPVGVVATVGAVIAAYHYGEPALPLVLVLSVAVCTIWYLIDAGGERPMANVGATLLGICWVGMFGAFAGLLLGAPNGIAMLLAAIVPTVGYDVGALFVGRSAGSRPLSAASPNKTLEGLVGGMVLAVVGGLLLSVLNVTPFDSLGEGLKIGLIAAVAAPLGDLSESLIKRDLGIKDMGSLLPGHGGVLDRFDALLFVLPAVWYMARVSDFFLA